MAEDDLPAVNPELLPALKDARVLISYAAEAGMKLDPGILRTVVQTGSRLRDAGTLSDEQEAAFWQALNQLSRAISPISITSLRATMDSYSPGRKMFGFDVGQHSKARWAVYKYTLGLSLTLAILLVMQVYWLFGNWIVGDIHKQKKDVVEAEAKVLAYRKELAGAGKVPVRAADGTEDAELDKLRGSVRHNQLQLDASYRLLKEWSRYWEDTAGVDEVCKLTAAQEAADQKAAADGKTARRFAHRVASCENVARHQAVAVVLETLQRYVLPLLYGLLGCCVFILRTLSTEIRGRTYTEASNIGFRIRLYLGTLGGMIVAWFVTPESGDVFKTLSPLALAFLAGYSIELVFTAMDRIIGAFTGKTPDQPARAVPQ